MKNSVSSRKELTILKIEEDVFDFRHSTRFRQSIENLLKQEASRNIIIDFSQVKAIDSSGISSMLIAHQLSNQSQGLAVFVSLGQQIKDLLKLTNLDKQLYIFSSINEVMTLIEPAMKNRRGGRGKVAVGKSARNDEINEDCHLILDDEIISDDSLEMKLDDAESNEEAIMTPEPGSTVKLPRKKRGRPKKTPDCTKRKPERPFKKPQPSQG